MSTSFPEKFIKPVVAVVTFRTFCICTEEMGTSPSPPVHHELIVVAPPIEMLDWTGRECGGKEGEIAVVGWPMAAVNLLADNLLSGCEPVDRWQL
jgi:hypothetical protein